MLPLGVIGLFVCLFGFLAFCYVVLFALPALVIFAAFVCCVAHVCDWIEDIANDLRNRQQRDRP